MASVIDSITNYYNFNPSPAWIAAAACAALFLARYFCDVSAAPFKHFGLNTSFKSLKPRVVAHIGSDEEPPHVRANVDVKQTDVSSSDDAPRPHTRTTAVSTPTPSKGAKALVSPSKKKQQQVSSDHPHTTSKKKLSKKEKRRRGSHASPRHTTPPILAHSQLSEEEKRQKDAAATLAKKKFEEMCKAEELKMLEQARAVKELGMRMSGKSNSSHHQEIVTRTSRSVSAPVPKEPFSSSYSSSPLIPKKEVKDEEQSGKKSPSELKKKKSHSADFIEIESVEEPSTSATPQPKEFKHTTLRSHEAYEAQSGTKKPLETEIVVSFRVHCPEIPSVFYNGLSPVHIATSVNGDWKKLQVLPLKPCADNCFLWEFCLPLSNIVKSFAYKYVAWDISRGGWEMGPTRVASLKHTSSSLVLNDEFEFESPPVIPLPVMSAEVGQPLSSTPEYPESLPVLSMSQKQSGIHLPPLDILQSEQSVSATWPSKRRNTVSAFPSMMNSEVEMSPSGGLSSSTASTTSSPSGSSPWSSTLLLDSVSNEEWDQLSHHEDNQLMCNMKDAEDLVSNLFS